MNIDPVASSQTTWRDTRASGRGQPDDGIEVNRVTRRAKRAVRHVPPRLRELGKGNRLLVLKGPDRTRRLAMEREPSLPIKPWVLTLPIQKADLESIVWERTNRDRTDRHIRQDLPTMVREVSDL